MILRFKIPVCCRNTMQKKVHAERRLGEEIKIYGDILYDQ